MEGKGAVEGGEDKGPAVPLPFNTAGYASGPSGQKCTFRVSTYSLKLMTILKC